MSEMVNQFYDAIRSGDVPALDALIDPEFCLICPHRTMFCRAFIAASIAFLKR